MLRSGQCRASTSTTTRRPRWSRPRSNGSPPWRATPGATRRASTISASRPRPRSTRRGPRWPACSAPSRPKSSSPPAAPKATTPPCAAPPRPSKPSGRRHLIVSAIEHEAVLQTAKSLSRRGFEVSILPVGSSGVADPDALRGVDDRSHGPRIGHARQQRDRHGPAGGRAGRHCPQPAGRCSTPTPCRPPASCRSTSARSASTCCRFRPTSSAGRRAPARCGSAAASACSRSSPAAARSATAARAPRTCRRWPGWAPPPSTPGAHAADAAPRIAALRDRLEQGILDRVSGAAVNGERSARVPNTTNISFDRVESESLLIALDLEGIAVSSGSACSSGTLEPSHVLKAMGLPASSHAQLAALQPGQRHHRGGDRPRRRGGAGAGREAPSPGTGEAVTMSRRPHRRRDVGRRGLVGGRGAAGRSGPRRGRRVDAALRPARGRLRFLLHDRRPARCPAGRGAARHSPLHRQLRVALPRPRRSRTSSASTRGAGRRSRARTATARSSSASC